MASSSSHCVRPNTIRCSICSATVPRRTFKAVHLPACREERERRSRQSRCSTDAAAASSDAATAAATTTTTTTTNDCSGGGGEAASQQQHQRGTGTASAGGALPVIIFLDVDGVLNCRDGRRRGARGPAALHEDLVARFVGLVVEFRARVVLSTSWRLVPDLRSRLLGNLAPVLAAAGRADIDEVIVGDTARLHTPQYRDSRGAEIEAWLRDNQRGKVAWIAIDDVNLTASNSELFAGHHVHTSMDHGFNKASAAEARRFLHRQGAAGEKPNAANTPIVVEEEEEEGEEEGGEEEAAPN